MIKRIISLILVLALSMSMFMLVGCGVENNKRTTKDGIVYYLSDESGELGAYILDLPDKEEVVIPEYVDGYKVLQIGYYEKGFFYSKYHRVDKPKIKKLTLLHNVKAVWSEFLNLEVMVFMDILYYVKALNKKQVDKITMSIHSYNRDADIELKKSDREFDVDYTIEYFYINEKVKVIEAGVFDGLEGTIIRTSYESKPEGWEDGWNGNCQVEWGVNLD